MEYTDLLKPFTLRNFVIKNRLEHPSALPHFSQGTEKYPGEEIMQHYIELAKNGFGIVTIAGVNSFCGFSALPDVMDISHFPDYDIYDPKCQNYIVQLTEAIHSYGAIASMALVPASNGFPLMNENGEMEIICPTPTGKMNTGGSFTILDPKHEMNEDGVPASELISDDIPAWVFEKIAESHGQQALKLKQLGFDMITIHMSYRGTIMGKMLTAVTNKRTDDYGGDITGRAKFPLMVLKAIRDAVGNHFIIEFHISGEEKMKNGNTIEDTVAFLKMAEKYADIVQIRGNDIDSSSPTGLTLEKYPFLCYAEQVKKSGTKLLVSSVGGWQKPSDAQNAIADGKCDIIAVGRGAIADPDFIKKTIAGQEEDIIPCIRCNRCHGRGKKDPFATVCSVNPCFGLERFKDTMTQNFSKKQKQIAIIGGGPGGMRAAILLNDRGHQVTLFEASDRLGGALKHTDYVPFKWPLKNYKNWLISQVEKRAIDVHLNTCVTPDSIKRIQLGSSGYIIGTVIQMACASFTMTLVNAFGGGVAAWRNTALIFAVLGIASLALCALGNKEIPELESNTMDDTPTAKNDITFFEGIKYLFRNKYFFIMVAALIVFNTIVTAMMTTAPYYAKYILKNENLNGIITMIILLPVVISMLFTPMLTKKFGLYKVNKNGYWASFVLSILCLIFALKGFTLPLFITMFLRSLGMGPFAGTQNAIVAQLCEYSERKDHVHIEGFLFSCTSFGIKVGGGIAATLVGWALSAGGYVGTASTQSSGALTAIILVFAGIPAILTIVNAALLSALKVEKANADLKSND